MTVNPVANEVYMTNSTDNTVTFINGVTLATTTLAVGTSPADVEVNPTPTRFTSPTTATTLLLPSTVYRMGKARSASAADLPRLS